MAMHHASKLCPGCVIAVEAALAQGAGPWAREYLDLVGEAETAAGRPAVPGRSEVTR